MSSVEKGRVKRVLWIEDSANAENLLLSMPVYLSGKYDLQIAMNATEGMRALATNEFDAVVVDVRLPPGNDVRWVAEYYQRARSAKLARLGLALLRLVLRGAPHFGEIAFPATARDPRRYGLLTVEQWEGIAMEVQELGVRWYAKNAGDPRALLHLIAAITTSGAEDDQ